MSDAVGAEVATVADTLLACIGADEDYSMFRNSFLRIAAAMLRSLADEVDRLDKRETELLAQCAGYEWQILALTAPAAGDRAELVRWHNMVARTQRSNDWAPHAGEIAEKHERTAALLEADARREVALAEAIREIEAIGDDFIGIDADDILRDVLAILAKVSTDAQQ
jgi:hypothetical protein